MEKPIRSMSSKAEAIDQFIYKAASRTNFVSVKQNFMSSLPSNNFTK